jgi:hypothetical protein
MGGQVLIVSKTPQFIRDVCPYFQTTGILVSAHFIYMYTGNLCLSTWLLYMACPISNFIGEGDNTNLSIKSEKAFLNDKRFWYPLWAYNIAETITWIWALIVMSDQVSIDHYWFQMKPQTTFQYFMFTFTWGYFAALNAINGHELLHKKEWFNKYFGTWAYTKFMYSHFLDEHIKGHHKMVSTPGDPATAWKNETVYHFLYKSVTGGVRNVWNRESNRIKKEQGEDVGFLAILIQNKMSLYTIIHLSILVAIYTLLGW